MIHHKTVEKIVDEFMHTNDYRQPLDSAKMRSNLVRCLAKHVGISPDGEDEVGDVSQFNVVTARETEGRMTTIWFKGDIGITATVPDDDRNIPPGWSRVTLPDSLVSGEPGTSMESESSASGDPSVGHQMLGFVPNRKQVEFIEHAANEPFPSNPTPTDPEGPGDATPPQKPQKP
jgi:hypothetical protein